MSLLAVLGPVVALAAGVEALTGVLSGPKARPIDIDVSAALLTCVEQSPRRSRLEQAVQRDAHLDRVRPAAEGEAHTFRFEVPADAGLAEPPDPLFAVIAGPSAGRALNMQTLGQGGCAQQRTQMLADPRILLLSGGGAWGAFGAGFLKGLSDAGTLPRFDVITGVSTGAVLGLLLASGSAAEAEAEYVSSAVVGHTRGRGIGAIGSLMKRGGLTDLSPMIARLERWLLAPAGDGTDRMARLAQGKPLLLVGAVDMASGDFRIFNLTRLASNAGAEAAERAAAARAIAGIVAGSSAIPMQMVPVRLRYTDNGRVRTLADGGVRLSVFDAHVGEVVNAAEARRAEQASAAERAQLLPAALYVIRNGPTIARPSLPDPANRDQTMIDSYPHVLNMMERGQAVLVNQNEVGSITTLRLSRPETPIFVATADGYSQAKPPCTIFPSRAEPFPTEGMRCLARHGGAKAREKDDARPPWIRLPTLSENNVHQQD
jgi:hypothetical protein